MRNRIAALALCVFAICLISQFLASPALAVSQWSRKYEVACTTCHTAFPRLNYYGEQFMLNGFQLPDDDPDGDIAGKEELNEDTFIDKAGHWFGARLNLTPLQLKTDKITVDGVEENQLGIGKTNWVQFFVAGSIFKNVSIFIEQEFKGHDFHFSWYHMGFHNLGGTSLLNFQVGNLSPLDFASMSNRLRIMAPVKADMFGVAGTGGVDAADNLSVSGYRPGIQYYGYKGPVVLWAGISPGKDASDINTDKHYWGGLKLQVTSEDSAIQGSSASIWYYDASDGSEDPSVLNVTNDYSRLSLQGNLRVGTFDLQAAYLDGSDDNWDLSDPGLPVDWDGIALVASYVAGKWFPAVAYDKVSSDDMLSLEKQITTLSLAYHPRENWRLGLYARIDMESDSDYHNKSHDIFFNIRTMF